MTSLVEIFKMLTTPPSEEAFCQYPVTINAKPPGITKRPADIVFSLTAIIMTMPVWLITIIAIYLEDRGPIFFIQPRVGKDGKLFNLLKFRSMVPDAEARKADLLHKSDVEGAFKMKDDPRVTRVGKLIRKYKIDELPQLLNVLAGTMTVVGPRPTSLEEVKRVYNEEFCQKFIAGARPGLTGLTQVIEAKFGKMNLADQIKSDVDYLENQGFLFDLSIILLTAPAVLFGRGS